jgi:hypothetical protein
MVQLLLMNAGDRGSTRRMPSFRAFDLWFRRANLSGTVPTANSETQELQARSAFRLGCCFSLLAEVPAQNQHNRE